MNYETYIDPTDFGTVADYLQDRKSPIEFIMHVKDRNMLPRIAEELECTMHSDLDATLVGHSLLRPLIKDGALMLSPREPFAAPVTNYVIAASSIPRSAACEVIYFPPFYLVHTPGLFESTLIHKTVALRSQAFKQKPRGIRIKP